MPENIPNKLIFAAGNSTRKKRSFILIALLAIIQICLIWPVYPLFGSAEPLILGIPLSFFWVILMVLTSFFALLTFFIKENQEE